MIALISFTVMLDSDVVMIILLYEFYMVNFKFFYYF